MTKSWSVALPEIHTEATRFSESCRGWYWKNSKIKKGWSKASRSVTFLLALAGIASPLIAAVAASPQGKLAWTQLGVVALALAGAFQLGDQVFGWSSGWLRYVTTVTAMERLTLQFDLDWTAYLLAREGDISDVDVKPLFELARQFELELEKRRGEETDAWVAEFNKGLAALNQVLKSQRDETEKAAATSRTAMAHEATPNKPESARALPRPSGQST